MSSCSSTPYLTGNDIPDAEPKVFISGEKKRIKLNIYEPKDNAALDNNCSPNRNNIVIPTTITVTNAEVNIYLCTDFTTPLITDTPAQTDIIDSKLQKVGVQLSYSVDTSNPLISAVGNYCLVFSYTVDGLENFVVPCYFNVVALSCLNGNC